jgi:hypothetical protein
VLVLGGMTDDPANPAEPPEEGSALIVALHVVMWTTLACGLIAAIVVVLLNR